MRRALIALVVGLISTGAVQAQPPPPPFPYQPVPPPRREPIPPPPGGRFVWEPGHWHWNGRQYIWITGRYVETRPRQPRWVEGQWIWGPRAQRWFWRPAHWE